VGVGDAEGETDPCATAGKAAPEVPDPPEQAAAPNRLAPTNADAAKGTRRLRTRWTLAGDARFARLDPASRPGCRLRLTQASQPSG
jgi:hypothetical protein